MPTVAELERLGALVDRLTPLGNVQRGELIRAQDWNTLVGTMIEVARAVLASQRSEVVPVHDHPDQVTLGWLNPQLRSLIERGSLSDPAAEAKVAELDRRLVGVASRIDAMTQTIQEVRENIADVSTRDLVRESAITKVQRVVENVSGVREDVLTLRQTLGSIQQQVKVAVDVGSRLTIEGQPADLEAVGQRLKAVEQLRDQLRTPSGDLLDASALERRLTQLTNTLVTEEELDSALRTRPGVIPTEQITSLRDQLQATVTTDLATTKLSLAAELRAETNQRLSEVNGLVSRAVADTLPEVTQSILGATRSEIATAVRRGAEDSQAAFEKQLGDVTASLQTSFNSQIGEVQRNVVTTIRSEFERQLPSQLDPIRQTVSDLSLQAKANTTKLVEHDENITRIGTRIETVARQEAASRQDLQKALTTEMERRDQVRQKDLDTRFTQSKFITSEQLDQSLTTARTGILQQVTEVANTAAASQVKATATQLRGEMRAIAQDEVSANQVQIRTLITTETQRSLSQIPEIVNQQVRLNSGRVIRSEINSPNFQQVLNQTIDQRLNQ